MANLGLIGFYFKVSQAIFVKSLTDNFEEKEKARKTIQDRQEYVEKTPGAMPLGIFPEGGMSNNKCLLPFKRGAFEAGLSIRPLVLKYTYDLISPQTFMPKLV